MAMRDPRQFIPSGSWPMEMRADMAAAFCDEPSVEVFKAKVERGIYSQPVRQKGCLPKWHRERLTHDIAIRHGLQQELLPLRKNLEHLI
ncbi:hypothetical protein SB2_12145 [Methylobacterium radiotolerans]|nr:hypothetical protein SB3_06750 [Methylobacterium radiotolerans]KTS47930.1 hypothetical protein SB2_12145 [Methylobacterium radiotolerans]